MVVVSLVSCGADTARREDCGCSEGLVLVRTQHFTPRGRVRSLMLLCAMCRAVLLVVAVSHRPASVVNVRCLRGSFRTVLHGGRPASRVLCADEMTRNKWWSSPFCATCGTTPGGLGAFTRNHHIVYDAFSGKKGQGGKPISAACRRIMSDTSTGPPVAMQLSITAVSQLVGQFAGTEIALPVKSAPPRHCTERSSLPHTPPRTAVSVFVHQRRSF